MEAVWKKPYQNDIHEFLKVLAIKHRPALTKTLVAWLTREGGVTDNLPIARNFAAYVLGTIGATDAANALARTAQQDRGLDVRLYCVTSLAKLRSRRHLSTLVRLYHDPDNREIEDTVAAAICHIVGIARYAF